MLGVHLTTDRRPPSQYNILIRRSKALGAQIANNHLNSQHLYTAITQYIQPIIPFALVPQRLTTLQIHQLQSAVLVPTTNPPQVACIIENESPSPPHARIPWRSRNPQLEYLQLSTTTPTPPNVIRYTIAPRIFPSSFYANIAA